MLARREAILAGTLASGVATLVALMARGRLTLDTGWGRTVTPLRPMTLRIEAPRELVFDYLASPYLGRTPRSVQQHLHVWERGTDMVVAAHFSRLQGYTAETLEAVRFERPERISFRHLRGPVPHAEERFELTEEDGATVLHYHGEVGLDFWGLGKLAAVTWVVPTWERTVRASLETTRSGAEALAAARARRAPASGGAPESP
jgi:hypothetical protein